MSWEKEIVGIQQRRKLALEHGGQEAVARQHGQGRLTIHERIDFTKEVWPGQHVNLRSEMLCLLKRLTAA